MSKPGGADEDTPLIRLLSELPEQKAGRSEGFYPCGLVNYYSNFLMDEALPAEIARKRCRRTGAGLTMQIATETWRARMQRARDKQLSARIRKT